MSARRVLVTGSRHWTDKAPIYRALYAQKLIGAQVVIVHGDCPTGADAIAATWANHFYPDNVTVEAYPADWNRWGKAAGPMRNQRMVDLGADVCLAFPFPDSQGTLDCILRAQAAGIDVIKYPLVAVA